MSTIPAGSTATFQATGPVVVRLGAPPYVSVQLDGIAVSLPSNNVQPYDLTFTPTSSTSA